MKRLSKEEMLDRVIKERGFEDSFTIWFAKAIDTNLPIIILWVSIIIMLTIA